VDGPSRRLPPVTYTHGRHGAVRSAECKCGEAAHARSRNRPSRATPPHSARPTRPGGVRSPRRRFERKQPESTCDAARDPQPRSFAERRSSPSTTS
jgi:hypothetical protein